MDPLSLTVAALLAQKAAEGFADSAAKTLWDRLDGLRQKVVARFRGEPAAETALAALAAMESEPGDAARMRAVAAIIEEHIRTHEPFRDALADEVTKAAQDPALAPFITTVSGQAHVGKIVNIEHIHGDVTF